MIIRPEQPQDFDRIYDLVKIAFQTAQVSDGKEQEFANRLRCQAGYIPDLALVAEDDGQLVGHVMLTKTYVLGDAARHEMLLLGPISVVLERRSQGVGTRLLEESFRRARELGYTSVILVGNPAFYGRFGFRKAADFGIGNTNGIPDEFVMARELVDGALAGVKGAISF